MRAFYIGRFQPYHFGHQGVLEEIARGCDEIIIGVGSAQLSHTFSDPFTAGERILMITRSLKDLDALVYVIPIEDIRRNAVWVSHVMAMTPLFDVAYTSNPYVIRLFKEARFDVKSPPLYQREVYSGSEIRKRMLHNEPWQHLVPEPVVQVIEQIDGVHRLKQVAAGDKTSDLL
ncbi:MAG TPA: nicotinamide-nucleotide adenylyltransferase [Candidatus Bathyarchaeia archaeon]|nr:nicotinamide-nucleotide adenylyltransferase [Candidatus Bathyarchaeia archaeon]